MTRTVTIRDDGAPPSIVVPRGRSVAERRLGALAALHQPIMRMSRGIPGLEAPQPYYVCGECKVSNDMGRMVPASWPCTTARLMGPWPGESPEDA